MTKICVPAAPQPSFAKSESAQREATAFNSVSKTPASKISAPLDAAFLRRVYLSALCLGVVLSFVIWSATNSSRAAVSFAAGLLIAAGLMKLQEILVPLILRPKSLSNFGAKLLLIFVLPLKYLAVITGLWWLLSHHLAQPMWFASGCAALQFVLAAKVCGRVLHRKMRPIHDVYVKPFTNHV